MRDFSLVTNLPYWNPFRPIFINAELTPNLSFPKERCMEIRDMFSTKDFSVIHEIGNASKAIHFTEKNLNLFDDIYEIAKDINDLTYQFHIDTYEAVYHIYDNYEHNYGAPHVDCNMHRPNTKLVICVQLSDYTEYEGCELVVQMPNNQSAYKSIGSISVFPGFAPHYITQLTKGIRHSLCLFIKGNKFV